MRSVHLIAKGHARARSPKTLVTSHIYLFDGHLMETSQRPERPPRRLDPPRPESRGSLSPPAENDRLSRRKLNESSKVPAASLSRPGDLVRCAHPAEHAPRPQGAGPFLCTRAAEPRLGARIIQEKPVVSSFAGYLQGRLPRTCPAGRSSSSDRYLAAWKTIRRTLETATKSAP